MAVTASAISSPILKACSLVAPFNKTNMLPDREASSYFQFFPVSTFPIHTREIPPKRKSGRGTGNIVIGRRAEKPLIAHVAVSGQDGDKKGAYLSVSPYTTRAPHFLVSLTILMALSKVSRALWTMLSPT